MFSLDSSIDKEFIDSYHNILIKIDRKKFKNECRKRTHRMIRLGLIKKEPCDVCGDLKVHAHHPDYREARTILWLCPKHHSMLHKYTRRAEQGNFTADYDSRGNLI